jgi:GNAT superfamily N-acetyltransferase
MGTTDDELTARATYEALLSDDQWLIVVAERSGDILGYAAAQDYGPRLRATKAGRFGRLHDVYVSENHRREGIGRTLMQAVESWAARRVSYLHWQAHQERAAPFYERLGYRGDPCPQPDYPEFEVAFAQASERDRCHP